MFADSFKVGVSDGEVWSLADRFSRSGYQVNVFDGYMWKRNVYSELKGHLVPGKINVIVVHIWKTEIYGEELAKIGRSLSELRGEHSNVFVIAFGYIANAISEELFSANLGVDAIVTATDWAPHSDLGKIQGALRPVLVLIRNHLRAEKASEPLVSLLCEAPEIHKEKSVVSLHASRGCRSRCTFCAYNSDLMPGWTPRSNEAVVAEIEEVVTRTSCSKIAFFDNDFGGGADELTHRSEALYVAMRDRQLLGKVQISINVRSECLTEHNMFLLSEIGVKTMLIGLESLNDNTRARIFGKRLDVVHLERVLARADSLGIQVVLSYILWHPWQTVNSLRDEICGLVHLGRHRVPQFLSRSILRVVPGTAIEAQLKREGLLKSGSLRREFSFVDILVGDMFQRHSDWLRTQLNLMGRDPAGRESWINSIAALKIQELAMYQDDLGT